MAFCDQIYRQTKMTTSQCHECETRFIKMSLTCPPAPVNLKNAQNTPLEFVCCH
ncbi:hypothetical protein SHLI107390_05930 [Shewanella livingstonensis]